MKPLLLILTLTLASLASVSAWSIKDQANAIAETWITVHGDDVGHHLDDVRKSADDAAERKFPPTQLAERKKYSDDLYTLVIDRYKAEGRLTAEGQAIHPVSAEPEAGNLPSAIEAGVQQAVIKGKVDAILFTVYTLQPEKLKDTELLKKLITASFLNEQHAKAAYEMAIKDLKEKGHLPP